MAPRTARGYYRSLTQLPDHNAPPSETAFPGPDPDPLQPLPRTRLTPLNSPLTPPNSPPPKTETKLFLDHRTKSILRAQAKTWANRNLPTSKIRHRPPLLTAYVEFLVRERERLSPAPRAVSEGESKRRVRFARAVAPWSPTPHMYDRPKPPPRLPLDRPSAPLRYALLTEFPKNGDAACRKKALEALQFKIISAVWDNEVLEPSTISICEVERLRFLKPADAVRFCEAAAAKGGGR